jgi:hypothetical protein
VQKQQGRTSRVVVVAAVAVSLREQELSVATGQTGRELHLRENEAFSLLG